MVGGTLAVVRAAVGAGTRRWVTWSLTWTPRRKALAALVIAVVVVWLEIRQQLRADLLVKDTWTL